MFYSQFILAKKGPLGTIWIAAHLERKLRKNQVADTDIGVSVDSILFPDVPIALRLSSHLLLGVVRIYSRKVNYLFDDCSDALLKVKQAFRSAAVDLPPEESKAPYHSITLPETFDLDDFELPENDIFQGNFVDHHISSREQITLQDTMEGVTYSTSKFGLDERFGDGDASGLDLDEELFLDKIGTAEHANGSADPQASTMILPKQDEFPESRNVNSEPRVDDDNNDYADDVMDYAHAPCTPGLVEEPTLSNVKEVSACDDHLESEYHLVENDKNEDNPSVQANLEHVSGNESSLDKVEKTLNPSSEFVDKIIEASDVEDLQNGGVEKDKSSSPTVDKPCHDQEQEIGLEKSACEISALTNNSHQVSDDLSAKDQDIGLEKSACEISGLTSNSHQVSEGSSAKNQENASEQEKSDLDTKNEDEYFPENPENGACDHEKAASTETLFLRPLNSNVEQHDITVSGVQLDAAGLATSGMEETVMLGEACCLTDNPEFTKENQIEEHEPEKEAEAELPAPEKLLSVPQGHEYLHENMVIEGKNSPIGLDEGDAGSKIISGKKRSFTESTLTEQSLNSVESSRLVRFKRTIDSVPDDDDLLSSILVGRSSVLKVKPTPRLSEVTSTKRTRSAPPKRKIVMDDAMVLHGDTIRQQLTNTEDIRRVRKKAPCTRPEISMLKKQFLEDQIFSEPLYKGMSIELASLHNEICDLSGITVFKDELDSPSPKLPFENAENALETMAEPISPSHDVKNDDTLATAAEPHLTSQNAENDEPLDIENDEASLRPNDTEQNEERITNEVSLDRDNNEVAEPSENPVLVDNRTEELDQTNLEINISKEQINDISQQEPLLEVTEVETGPRNENAAILADEKMDMPVVEFDAAWMDVDNGQAISRDEFVQVRDDEVAQDDAKQGELEYNQHILDSSYPAQVCLQEGIFGNNDEQYMMDVESSGFDLHDLEELKYSAAGNDTEFLNVDDDDLTEMADDDDDEARFAENTGWSSRTRAVSKYLQTLFMKEAESGRKLSLSMENLLIGKSRKEASRMFFEALVLKTRDYIHVEQRNTFDDITIKPRTRLLKSEF